MLTVGVNGYARVKESAKVEAPHAILRQRNSQVVKQSKKYRSFSVFMKTNIYVMENAFCSPAKRLNICTSTLVKWRRRFLDFEKKLPLKKENFV